MKKIIFIVITFLLFSFNIKALTLKDGTVLPKLPLYTKNFVVFNHKHYKKTMLITTENEYYLTFDYQGVSPSNTNLFRFNKNLEITDDYISTTGDVKMRFNNKWYRFYDPEKINSGNFNIYILENNEWLNVTNNPDYEISGYNLELPYNEEIIASNIKIYYRYPVDGHFEYKIIEANNNVMLLNINLYPNGGLINGELYDVYTTQINSDGLENLFHSLKIEKPGMVLETWCYDRALSLKLDKDIMIYDGLNLYAKFIYTDINDILANINFKNETFNSNYEYAIISSSNNKEDIYLGFEKLNFITEIEVYEYDENLKAYSENSVFCLVPIARKNNLNMYKLDLLNNVNGKYYVAVVRRMQLKEVRNGEVINYFNFVASENAHITYTNDLTNVVIMNDKKEEISTNLEPSFEYESGLNAGNENDLMALFKNLSEEKNYNIFSYFNQIWNYLKKSKIFSYILLCMSGSLIIFIVKLANRS